MQLTKTLRQSLLAAVVLGPTFIAGLALPWNANSGLSVRGTGTLLSELARVPHLNKIRQGGFTSGPFPPSPPLMYSIGCKQN